MATHNHAGLRVSAEAFTISLIYDHKRLAKKLFRAERFGGIRPDLSW